jgi:outer membrane protein OmpA-like peptidoglycan-associated protein
MNAVFEKIGREFCALLSNAAREDAQEKDGDDSSMEASEEEDNLASKTVSSVETTRQVFTCPPSGSSSDSSQDFEQENEKRQSNETSGDGTEKQPTEEAEPEARSRSTSSSRSSSSDTSFEAGSECVEAARKRLDAATERLNEAMERPAADSERLERMEVVDAWDEEWESGSKQEFAITEHVLSLV